MVDNINWSSESEEHYKFRPQGPSSLYSNIHWSSESAEHYTPPKYTNMARVVMKGINLDPASNKLAQTWINADAWYGPDQPTVTYRNGLMYRGSIWPWSGRIFLNPPYGRVEGQPDWYVNLCRRMGLSLNTYNQELWSKYLEWRYLEGCTDQAILLVKFAVRYQWFDYLFDRYPCVIGPRIQFISPEVAAAAVAEGRKPTEADMGSKRSKVASAFFYFGDQIKRFKAVFGQIGRYTEPS